MKAALVALALGLALPAAAAAQERAAYTHVVRPGETRASIATRHYGDPRRVSALIEANSQVSASQPDEGAELLIPYPLRHVSRQSETMRRVAQLYYDDQGEAAPLMRFNSMRRQRLPRGQIVLVPLSDLLLSDEGRQLIEEATGHPVTGGEVRELQTEINDELPILREHVRRGRYTEAVALGNRLLGSGNLTGNQIVTTQRELAVAYVALDRPDLAIEAFVTALDRQPELELDSRDTSPTVQRALQGARDARAERQAAAEPEPPPDGGVPDAGVPPEGE